MVNSINEFNNLDPVRKTELLKSLTYPQRLELLEGIFKNATLEDKEWFVQRLHAIKNQTPQLSRITDRPYARAASDLLDRIALCKAEQFLLPNQYPSPVVEHLTFDWANFANAHIANTQFSDCRFMNVHLASAALENCQFSDCEFRETLFSGASLNKVSFQRSSLISCSFEESHLTCCTITHASLAGTHFFEAVIDNCAITASQTTDTLFFDTRSQWAIDAPSVAAQQITRPIAAFLVHPLKRGLTIPKVFMKLDSYAHLLPLRITMHPPGIQKEALKQEVEASLKDLSPPYVAQRLLRKIGKQPDQHPLCTRIAAKIKKLSREVHAFVLPGGEDIPPALYGQRTAAETKWDGDYRRAMLELYIVHHAFNKGIPLMSICRGFQITNVYFGAELIQHIPGQEQVQQLAFKSGLYGELKLNPLTVKSHHHQAILTDHAARQHLETSVEYDGIVKAAEPREGGASPMILLQFHPEFYQTKTANSISQEFRYAVYDLVLSPANDLFFQMLADSADAYRHKKILKAQLIKEHV